MAVNEVRKSPANPVHQKNLKKIVDRKQGSNKRCSEKRCSAENIQNAATKVFL